MSGIRQSKICCGNNNHPNVHLLKWKHYGATDGGSDAVGKWCAATAPEDQVATLVATLCRAEARQTMKNEYAGTFGNTFCSMFSAQWTVFFLVFPLINNIKWNDPGFLCCEDDDVFGTYLFYVTIRMIYFGLIFESLVRNFLRSCLIYNIFSKVRPGLDALV